MLKIFFFTFLILNLINGSTKCELHYKDDFSKRYSPPNWQKSIFSPSNNFIIYFDTSGTNAPDSIDINQNRIPDYIDNVANSIDSIKYVLCDLMGYKSVPSVGEDPYPIYVSNRNSGSYGINYGVGNSTEAPNGWIEIDNNYNTGFYTAGIIAMQITLAHEYFHAIQRKYREITGSNVQSLRFFYEFSSTWIEDVIYPNHNDYIHWVDNFFDDPSVKIEDTDGYSIALFGHYINSMIENTNGIDGVFNKLVWEMLENNYSPPRNYINQILQDNYGLNFMNIWSDFTSLNYFNGEESSLHFYDDQILIDKILLPNPVNIFSNYSEILPVNSESLTITSVRSNLSGNLNVNFDEYILGKIIKQGSENIILNIDQDMNIQMQPNDVLKLVFYGENFNEIRLDYSLKRTPTAPSNLIAFINNEAIELSWNSSLNSGDSLKYHIYRNNTYLDYSYTNFYIDTNFDEYTEYYYEIRAQNENGYSGFSTGFSMIILNENQSYNDEAVISIFPNALRKEDRLQIIYDSNNLNSDIYIKLFDIDGNFINDMSLLNSVKGRQRSDLSGLIPINSSSGVYIMQFCFNTYNCSNHKITYLK